MTDRVYVVQHRCSVCQAVTRTAAHYEAATNALKLYEGGFGLNVKLSGFKLITFSPLRTSVAAMYPPGWMEMDSFETPAGTENVWDCEDDVSSVTEHGDAARTIAHTLS